MFEFGTKAETLESLRGRISRGRVCRSIVFTVRDWERNPDLQIGRIRETFGSEQVIVRSSALAEDGKLSAMAGMHESILDVPADRDESLADAVKKVIASYRRAAPHIDEENQILVQPMVRDISMSGVVFTHDLNTGGPYYVINYDDVSGKTDTVTSGTGDSALTLLVHRDYHHRMRSPRFKALLDAVVEIEEITQDRELDIEFAVTRDHTVHILQVRRLTTQQRWNQRIVDLVDVALEEITAFLLGRMKPLPGVYGKKSILGVMPDWNPAEMIGAVPRQLAMSLYRYLITDSVWAEARAQMGYRDRSRCPLMVNLSGRPYIDVRESFNSFLPADLSASAGEALVNHWSEVLESHPEYHDKIEFDVATTIHSLDFNTRARDELEGTVLTPDAFEHYRDCLHRLTDKIIGGTPDMVQTQLSLIDELVDRHDMIMRRMSADMDRTDILVCVRDLLEDCRRLGTRPFSILARCGFIAEEFLRSAVRRDLFSAARASAFRASVRTTLSAFVEMAHDVRAGRTSEADFYRQYGHLRPGTYDILSPRYDQRIDAQGPAHAPGGSCAPPPREDALGDDDMEALERCLRDEGFSFPADRLLDFMRASIAGREHAKLQFTRNVSDALELIAAWGNKLELDRDLLSHLSVVEILDAQQVASGVRYGDDLRAKIETAKRLHPVSKAVKLPYLITSLSDVHVVPLLKCRPNFVTHKKVSASGVFLSGHESDPARLSGAIVLIEGADPGYDWIFMHDIAGLITKFGGANSHMAIRCAELGIPAAIGCGEQLFEHLIQVRQILLDCGAELVMSGD